MTNRIKLALFAAMSGLAVTLFGIAMLSIWVAIIVAGLFLMALGALFLPVEATKP